MVCSRFDTCLLPEGSWYNQIKPEPFDLTADSSVFRHFGSAQRFLTAPLTNIRLCIYFSQRVLKGGDETDDCWVDGWMTTMLTAPFQLHQHVTHGQAAGSCAISQLYYNGSCSLDDNAIVWKRNRERERENVLCWITDFLSQQRRHSAGHQQNQRSGIKTFTNLFTSWKFLLLFVLCTTP